MFLCALWFFLFFASSVAAAVAGAATTATETAAAATSEAALKYFQGAGIRTRVSATAVRFATNELHTSI